MQGDKNNGCIGFNDNVHSSCNCVWCSGGITRQWSSRGCSSVDFTCLAYRSERYYVLQALKYVTASLVERLHLSRVTWHVASPVFLPVEVGPCPSFPEPYSVRQVVHIVTASTVERLNLCAVSIPPWWHVVLLYTYCTLRAHFVTYRRPGGEMYMFVFLVCICLFWGIIARAQAPRSVLSATASDFLGHFLSRFWILMRVGGRQPYSVLVSQSTKAWAFS